MDDTLDDNGDIELILKEWEDSVASSEDELKSPPTPPAPKEIIKTVEKVSYLVDYIFRSKEKRAKMVTLSSTRSDHYETPSAAEAQDLPLVEDDLRTPASTSGNHATETLVQEALYPE
jgi:hypothetical protein